MENYYGVNKKDTFKKNTQKNNEKSNRGRSGSQKFRIKNKKFKDKDCSIY